MEFNAEIVNVTARPNILNRIHELVKNLEKFQNAKEVRFFGDWSIVNKQTHWQQIFEALPKTVETLRFEKMRFDKMIHVKIKHEIYWKNVTTRNHMHFYIRPRGVTTDYHLYSLENVGIYLEKEKDHTWDMPRPINWNNIHQKIFLFDTGNTPLRYILWVYNFYEDLWPGRVFLKMDDTFNTTNDPETDLFIRRYNEGLRMYQGDNNARLEKVISRIPSPEESRQKRLKTSSPPLEPKRTELVNPPPEPWEIESYQFMDNPLSPSFDRDPIEKESSLDNPLSPSFTRDPIEKESYIFLDNPDPWDEIQFPDFNADLDEVTDFFTGKFRLW